MVRLPICRLPPLLSAIDLYCFNLIRTQPLIPNINYHIKVRTIFLLKVRRPKSVEENVHVGYAYSRAAEQQRRVDEGNQAQAVIEPPLPSAAFTRSLYWLSGLAIRCSWDPSSTTDPECTTQILSDFLLKPGGEVKTRDEGEEGEALLRESPQRDPTPCLHMPWRKPSGTFKEDSFHC